MSKFKKKPVVIDAFQYGVDKAPDWFTVACHRGEVTGNGLLVCEIKTLEGWVTCAVGNYVIKGVKNELYPCQEDIFKQTYEAVNE